MSAMSLTFYDTSSAYYASYYLKGFDDLKKIRNLKVHISNALPGRLKSAIKNPEWQNLLFAMSLFKFRQGNREWYFCIDTHDSDSVNSIDKTRGYHLPLLQCVDAYFKVNYNPEVIERTPELKVSRAKIRSIAQFFPVRPPMILSLSRRLVLPPILFGYKPGLDHDQPYAGYLADARKRLRDLRKFQSFEEIIAHRGARKDVDVFFVTSFYGKERHEAAMERRYQIMKRLACAPALNTVMGFTGFKKIPDKYADLFHRRLGRSEYLETLARARVVIYTQGMEACISSRFSLAMALGVAVAGEPLVNNPGLLTANTHLSEQFAYVDPDELADHAINLAADAGKARELGVLNAAMFDSQIAPRVTAEYILDTLCGC